MNNTAGRCGEIMTSIQQKRNAGEEFEHDPQHRATLESFTDAQLVWLCQKHGCGFAVFDRATIVDNLIASGIGFSPWHRFGMPTV